MSFQAPAWAPKLADEDIPDDLSLTDFVFNDTIRPYRCDDSPKPFIDSVNGFGYSVDQTRQRVEWLASGLAAHLGFTAITDNVFDRVVSIFAVNNVSNNTPRVLG